MKLFLDIKPRKVVLKSWATDGIVPSTKNEIVASVSKSGFVTFSRVSSGAIVTRDKKYVVAYNLQKFRRKTLAGKPKHKRKVVRPGHWVAYVYNIPVAFLESANLRVEQHARSFKLTKSR